MNIPSRIVAGDSYTWRDEETTDNLGNQISSSNTWLLFYVITGAVKIALTQSTTYQSGWQTVITAAQSATLIPAGTFQWQAYVTKSSERITLGTGQLIVAPNLSALAAGATTLKSQATIDLEAVQSAIRTLISGGAVQQYTIGNRSLQKMSMKDLLSLESKLKADVNKENKDAKIAQGLGNPDALFARFRK